MHICTATKLAQQKPNKEIRKAALGATDSVKWESFEKTIDAVKKLKTHTMMPYTLRF